MTNELFWELYHCGSIEVKAYSYSNPAAHDGEVTLGEIDAFEFENKFYLRIYKEYSPAGYRKRYKNGGSSSSSIKVFDTKNAANAYFIKAAAGYRRAF